MKRLLSTLVLISIHLPLIANSGFGLGLGFRTGLPRNKTYNQFVTSYNSYYANSLITPLSGLSPQGGYGLHADMNFEGLVMSMKYSAFYAKDKAELNNGHIRQLLFSQKFFTFGIGGGVQTSDGYFHLTGNVFIGDEMIKSATIYPGKHISYGMEKDLNGVFDNLRIGATFNLEIGYKMFFISSEYIVGSGKSILSDGNGQRMDNEHPWGLPTDINRWYSAGSAYDYGTDDFVLPITNGFRFEIGLRLNLSDD